MHAYKAYSECRIYDHKYTYTLEYKLLAINISTEYYKLVIICNTCILVLLFLHFCGVKQLLYSAKLEGNNIPITLHQN